MVSKPLLVWKFTFTKWAIAFTKYYRLLFFLLHYWIILWFRNVITSCYLKKGTKNIIENYRQKCCTHSRHGLLNKWTFILHWPAWGEAFNPNNITKTHSIFVKLYENTFIGMQKVRARSEYDSGGLFQNPGIPIPLDPFMNTLDVLL